MARHLLDTDTIAAIATPPGRGAIAVVKLSGPEAVSLSYPLFTPHAQDGPRTRYMHYGHISSGGSDIDEVLYCAMRAPHSYTGEDVVEIQCHGGHAAARAILRLCIDAGARPADPGEFTRRAFLNGKIDLVQAEAVNEIVTAESSEQLRRAEQLRDGDFSTEIADLSERLSRILSLFEANIDFMQDGLKAIDNDELTSSLSSLLSAVRRLRDSYVVGKRLTHGLTVAITGPVNVGKSTLYNRLLGTKRALVSDIPGTTRDWLEAHIEIDGLPVNLIDTAGIRSTEDSIEKEGVRESERILGVADCILSLFDPGEGIPSAEMVESLDTRCIPVLSKADLVDSAALPDHLLAISAHTGYNVQTLLNRITERAHSWLESSSHDTLCVVERHRHELYTAHAALERALATRPDWSEEITALELREACDALDRILGRTYSDDLLDRIFSTFCIGK